MDSVPATSGRPGARSRGAASSTRSRARRRARSPTSCARPACRARPRTGSRSRSSATALVVRDGDGRFRLGAPARRRGARPRARRCADAGPCRCSQRLERRHGRERAALRARGRPAGVRRGPRAAERAARHRAARRGAAARPGLGRQGAARLGRRRATGSTWTAAVLAAVRRRGWAATRRRAGGRASRA